METHSLLFRYRLLRAACGGAGATNDGAAVVIGPWGLQQLADQRSRVFVHLADRVAAAAAQLAERSIQHADAVSVDGGQIRTLCGEEAHEIGVALRSGRVQRRAALLIARVDIGTRIEQHGGRLERLSLGLESPARVALACAQARGDH